MQKQVIHKTIFDFAISILFIGLLTVGPSLYSASAETGMGITTRVSVDSNGKQGNRNSQDPSISSNGRFIVFASSSVNLVPGDTNGFTDKFVHDRQTGETIRVSVDSDGNQGNGYSLWVSSISGDGRFAAFSSFADNLVPGDTNSASDVFVHDRQTGETSCVSVDSNGNQGNVGSGTSSISLDGRFVAFDSGASSLVSGDTNSVSDVFVHDRQACETIRVSVDSSGNEGNGSSYFPSISSDGHFVVFVSSSNNLVHGDTNGKSDVFLHDLQTGVTNRISVDSSGNESNSSSSVFRSPSITADGRFIAFDSEASNLVPEDFNNTTDVFVHDRQTGETTLVSVDSDGYQGNGYSRVPSISSNGRFVAFQSNSPLVSEDTNSVADIFLHNRQTGETTRISVDSSGKEGNDNSGNPSISSNGQVIAFQSFASNLVSGDTNNELDIFVYERQPNNRLCADLGDDNNWFNLDRDLYRFEGSKGEKVTITLEVNEDGDNNGGKRAILILKDEIDKVKLLKIDLSKLPNQIAASLPADGKYKIIVAEFPPLGKRKQFHGDYCLMLEGTTGTLETLFD